MLVAFRVVAQRLGHANIAITLDTYSHAIPAMQEEAAALIEGLVFASHPVAAITGARGNTLRGAKLPTTCSIGSEMPMANTAYTGFTACPCADTDGHVVKWIGTAFDIEEERQFESTLGKAQRESTETLALLEAVSAKTGLGFIDREFRIIRGSEMLAAFSGVPFQRQIGRRIAEVAPGLWPQVKTVLHHVLQRARPSGRGNFRPVRAWS